MSDEWITLSQAVQSVECEIPSDFISIIIQMAFTMNKRDLHNSSADESVDFEPDFVGHAALPLAVRIDFQRKIC